MTSTICLFTVIHLNDLHYLFFEMVHLNNLLFDEWVDYVFKEVNVKEALKSPFFVIQKAPHQKLGKNFAMVLMVPSEVVYLRRTTSPTFDQ